MQQEQQQVDVGVTFMTGRVRPVVVAVITTLLTLVLLPWQPDFGDYPVIETILVILAASCLLFAVRNWRVVLRGRTGLRMTPVELTVTRRGRSAKRRAESRRQVREAILMNGLRYLDVV
jgi:hypothetical protein